MIRWLFRLALAAALALAGVLTVAFVDANWRFAHLEAAAPARVFSSPFALAEGTPVRRDDLLERLGRLGYRRVEGHPATPGEYAIRFRSYEIFLNAFDYPTHFIHHNHVFGGQVRYLRPLDSGGRKERLGKNLAGAESLARTDSQPGEG